jgi:hypothetical protein
MNHSVRTLARHWLNARHFPRSQIVGVQAIQVERFDRERVVVVAWSGMAR